jgi:hypothetical protein
MEDEECKENNRENCEIGTRDEQIGIMRVAEKITDRYVLMRLIRHRSRPTDIQKIL